MDFKIWHQYFLGNQDHFGHIDWDDKRPMTAAERRAISDSIRQFQRGEYSEGKHFLQFSTAMKDKNYATSIPLFIREEQDHSRVLGKFMAIHQIHELKKHWLDDAFRGLRKLAGLEGIISVLLTAETISMVYYKALSRATGSHLLQTICKQVLKDEVMHLRFQSYSLRVLYQRKSKLAVNCSTIIRKILLAGTTTMVWICHQAVLKAGGYGFRSFFRDVWKEFRKCNRMIKGEQSTMPVLSQTNRPEPIHNLSQEINLHHYDQAY